MDYLETVRARVRREATLWMRRWELSAWELAERIANSRHVPASSRYNSPKPAYRTIAGLLEGKTSQANTVNLVRSYLIAEAEIDPILLDVFPQTVTTAKAMLNALHPAPYNLKKADLLPYVGVYSVSSYLGPYVVRFIVDHEPTYNVLLVRCVLQEGGDPPECLHGYLIPGDHRFTVHLINPGYRTEYLILADHPERRLPFEPTTNTRLLGKANALVHLSVPIFEDGALRSFPNQPTRSDVPSEFEVEYMLRKHRPEHEDAIDILGDGYNFEIDDRDIGFYQPFMVDRWDRRPYFDD